MKGILKEKEIEMEVSVTIKLKEEGKEYKVETGTIHVWYETEKEKEEKIKDILSQLSKCFSEIGRDGNQVMLKHRPISRKEFLKGE
jgi:methyl coenzyme M reductase subunit D